MTLFQWIERSFQRRQVLMLLEWLASDERAADRFDPERLAIYRLPLPAEPRLVLGCGDEQAIPVQRGLWDLLGLGTRAYLIDSAPGSLFGKPNALAVFTGFGRPDMRVSERPLFIGDDPFDHFTPSFLATLQVHGPAPAVARGGPAVAALTVAPLAGPFPPTDLPNPGRTAAPPTLPPAPPVGPPGVPAPTYLFYGLCFQQPRPNKSALYFGPVKLRDAFLETDPLWDNTKAVALSFSQRGYAARTGLAGDHDPSGVSDASTFEKMMSGLANHLAGVTAYCNSAQDQLVLFVAAHGYGAPSNPTNDVAMHYKPVDSEDWITHDAFFQRLLAMPKIAAFPGKVTLLIYSCRSGRVFEGGVLPGGLAGMHLFTAAASSDVLAGEGKFPEWLRRALGDRTVHTWDDLLKHAKHTARTDTFGPPRNGDAAGCRAQVQLGSVAYQGDDIGGRWRYRVRADGLLSSAKGTAYEVPGSETTVAEHPLAVSTLDRLNLPIYDKLWPPCGPSNTVSLRFNIEATQTEGIDDTGRKAASISFTCDGSASQQVVAVPVTEGSKAADMKFSFSITTTCL